MKISRNILFRILAITLLLTSLFWIYVTFTELGVVLSPLSYYQHFLFIFTVLILSAFILLFTGYRIESIIPWHRNTGIRFGIGSLINLFTGMGWLVASGALYILLFHSDYRLKEFAGNYHDTLLKLVILVFVSIIAYTVIDFAVNIYRKYSTGQIETARIMREQLNLQFDALKKQMSPHFLFNSLNTISSLIYRNNDLAVAFIRKLARTYGSVLKYHDRQLIPVSDELELVESYGYLMSVRYEEAMRIEVNVDPVNLDFRVPPLSIQMLVENAIKHNQLSCENPLIIEIFSEGDYLYVKNNYFGQPKYLNIKNSLVENPVPAGSHHIGLENIKRRYFYLTSRQITIQKNSDFMVGIPLLKKDE